MKTYILLSSLLSLLATASPLVQRAGGPIAKPIPKACTVINPLPHATCGIANVDGYKLDLTFTKHNLLYQAYFEGFLSPQDQAKQCKQQCYGYGNTGDCKASFLGYRIPTPKGYLGTAGGELETGCLLFSAYLDPNTFVKAAAGQYVNATAANIYCPTS